MAGLVPAIHVFFLYTAKTWMPGTKAGHDEWRNAARLLFPHHFQPLVFGQNLHAVLLRFREL
jgi:hypothetical protein